MYFIFKAMPFLLVPLAVADTLLWKDKKLALTTLLVLMAFYHNFIASGYTIVTAVSKLFLVASIFLFIHGNLPEKMYACSSLFWNFKMPICISLHSYKLSIKNKISYMSALVQLINHNYLAWPWIGSTSIYCLLHIWLSYG